MLNAALSIQRKVLGDCHPDVLATLRGLALTLEQEKNWADAERVRREALVQWRKRAGDYDPEVIAEMEALIRVLVAEKKNDEAKTLLDQALTPSFLGQPSSTSLLALRIDLRARRSQWQEAASDAAWALRHQPNNNELYRILAALLAKIGDHAAYKEVCGKFFTAFGDTTNIFVSDSLAKSCLLLASSGVDLKAIDHLADAAVNLGTGDEGALPFFQVCKALSEYRQGHFAAAAEWAQKTLANPRAESHGQAYGVLAMAKWQLGEPDAGRVMLTRGNALVPQVLPASDAEDPAEAWLGWIFSRITLDEAAALFESEKHSVN
jgi:tetratricopeptide (TPR) repeat protein